VVFGNDCGGFWERLRWFLGTTAVVLCRAGVYWEGEMGQKVQIMSEKRLKKGENFVQFAENSYLCTLSAWYAQLTISH